MAIETIKAWEITAENRAVEHSLPDMSSLDAITRQLPQGLYTTFRTYESGERVLGFKAHLQRLYQPSADQQSKTSVTVNTLRRVLSELLGTYPGEGRVRLVMTTAGKVFIAIEPLRLLPPEVYTNGVKVITTGVERQTPRLKSTAFISASQGARAKIVDSRVFEALLVRGGFILEGMTSNFFYVREGKLGTARKDILLGVTRRAVLRVARGRGLEVVYKPLKREQVQVLEEAFLSSSSRGIVPIVQIDEYTVGEGRPGPVTKTLIKGYESYISRAAERIY